MATTSIFSIFGEWSGNVRSTPTPKDCLRTVNVSRAPDPWRLRTIPSKTWIRWRWPSITLKWTRTVSPALNCGRPSRSWARSRLSITLLIGRRAPKGRRQMLANVNPLGAALDLGHPADDVPQRHQPPDPRVARRGPVVAKEEEPPGRDRPSRQSDRVAPGGKDVRLHQPPPVDVDEAAALGPALSREPDQALDERAARAAAGARRR